MAGMNWPELTEVRCLKLMKNRIGFIILHPLWVAANKQNSEETTHSTSSPRHRRHYRVLSIAGCLKAALHRVVEFFSYLKGPLCCNRTSGYLEQRLVGPHACHLPSMSSAEHVSRRVCHSPCISFCVPSAETMSLDDVAFAIGGIARMEAGSVW